MVNTAPGARGRMVLAIVVLTWATAAAPAAAGELGPRPLLDRFSLRLEGSVVDLSTTVRLDSEALGRGTTLSFEDDLDLESSKTIPSLDFNWHFAPKHRLGVRWQKIDRNSSSQALTEIRWGDEVIPVEADITLGFDITQYYVDYAYYPWIKDRWSAGFGLGLRVMEFRASLAWQSQGLELEGGTDADGTGPLPYLYMDYLRLVGESWRMNASLGWLQLTVGDIDGGQYIGRLGIEYLLGDRWALGAALNLSAIDVDWEGVQTRSGDSLLTAILDLDINDLGFFVRLRF